MPSDCVTLDAFPALVMRIGDRATIVDVAWERCVVQCMDRRVDALTLLSVRADQLCREPPAADA
eukprot:gene2445-44792_t